MTSSALDMNFAAMLLSTGPSEVPSKQVVAPALVADPKPSIESRATAHSFTQIVGKLESMEAHLATHDHADLGTVAQQVSSSALSIAITAACCIFVLIVGLSSLLSIVVTNCKSPHSQVDQVEVVVQSVAALKTEIAARFDKLEAMLLKGSRP